MAARRWGERGSDEEEAGDRHEGSWYRGWRWRWQSQCPSARTGSRRVRSTTRGSSSLLCTERAGERNAQRRAGEGGGLARGEGGRGEGVQGGKAHEGRRNARGGAEEEEEEDSRWKANGQTGHRKGGNEMRRVCSPVPRRAFALARSLARVRAGYAARCSSSRAIRVLARRSARLLFSSLPAPRLSHFPRLSVLTPSFSLSPLVPSSLSARVLVAHNAPSVSRRIPAERLQRDE